MGPNGSGKSTLAYSIAGPPEVHRHRRHRDPRRRGRPRDDRRRARPRRPVPGHAVPRRGARRLGVELPAHRQDRDRRRGAQAAHLGQGRQRRPRASSTWTRPSPSARSTRASPAARRSATRSPSSSCSTPRCAILDETDSGLDIDALKIVSEGVNRFRAKEGKGVLLITHYTRILRYIKPDFVHVFVDGRIAEEGGPELADQLEAEGYDKYVKAPSPLVEEVSSARSRARHRDRHETPQPKGDLMEGLLPDLDVIRKDFPILSRTVAGGLPLVYLDSANTSQKPQVVIDTMVDHLERHNANVARAMHQLGAESTEAFEGARDKVAAFINAPSRDEVIFTKNASEALNLVANTLAWAEGDLRGRARRRGRHHRDGAPLQHRAVAAAHRAHRRDAALVRAHRRRPPRPVEHRRADQRAHQGRLADLGVQHARHHQPGRRDRRPGPRGRRDRGRRRLAGRAAAAGRRGRRPAPTSSAFTGHKVVGPTGIGVLWGRRERARRSCRRSSAAAR